MLHQRTFRRPGNRYQTESAAELKDERFIVLYLELVEGDPHESQSYVADVSLVDQSKSGHGYFQLRYSANIASDPISLFDFGAKLSCPVSNRNKRFFKNGSIRIKFFIKYDQDSFIFSR